MKTQSAAPHRFALLAEVCVIGAMTTIAMLGVVTAFGAIAAGCASLREYLEHDTAPGPRRYFALVRTASRGAIPLLALPVLIVVAAGDLLAWHAGMPGGRVLGPAAFVLIGGALVTALRAAASWNPESSEVDLLSAAREAAEDWRGSMLIAGALAACAALAFAIPALTLILPGLLTLAAVAVRARAR
jgi:hypothetical protein